MAVEIVAQSVVVISFLGINAVFERYLNFNGLVQSFMKVTVHIHDWSGTNSLAANLNKYADIVFVDNKRWRKLEVQPPPPLPNINRVTIIKIIAVTFTNTRSLAEHTHRIISSHAQALYAFRVLRRHCMDDSLLQTTY